MPGNVFGEPITEASLIGISQHVDIGIPRKNLAQAALERMNADNKETDAQLYAETLKNKWGRGTATMCLIYNATGGTISLSQHYDWSGHVAAIPYPTEPANGQWGVFLHVRATLSLHGSVGAVMYRGKNSEGLSCDWIMGWSNPWNRIAHNNQVVVVVRGESQRNPWPVMDDFFQNGDLHDTCEGKGCKASVTSGNDKRPFVKAVFTLQDLQ